MKGFFNKKETESVSSVGGKIHSCASCGLYKNCITPKMKPWGRFEKGIMLIGEGPDQTEDERGRPWQGKAGRMLQRTLRNKGIDMEKDCVSLNAVNCRPPNNRSPKPDEINHCRSVVVWKALQEYQPKVVLLFGGSALNSVVGYQWGATDAITKWRGFCIPDQELKTWLCPVYHPSYLQRMESPDDYVNIWNKDIERSLSKLDTKFPKQKKPQIEIVKDLSFLDDLQEGLYAFDYETTGIKPHGKGHRIRAAAIANSENHCWAFLMPKKKERRWSFRRWLGRRPCGKMAHNMKYEDTWSKNILKQEVKGWEWDSMLAAHIINNRPGITSLKFQMYVNFGLQDWSKEVEPYFNTNTDKEGANAINRIDELLATKSGKKTLLEYVGLDAVYQYRLALKQQNELNWDFLPF